MEREGKGQERPERATGGLEASEKGEHVTRERMRRGKKGKEKGSGERPPLFLFSLLLLPSFSPLPPSAFCLLISPPPSFFIVLCLHVQERLSPWHRRLLCTSHLCRWVFASLFLFLLLLSHARRVLLHLKLHFSLLAQPFLFFTCRKVRLYHTPRTTLETNPPSARPAHARLATCTLNALENQKKPDSVLTSRPPFTNERQYHFPHCFWFGLSLLPSSCCERCYIGTRRVVVSFSTTCSVPPRRACRLHFSAFNL